MRLLLLFLLFTGLNLSAQIDPNLVQQFETAFNDYGDSKQAIGMSIAIRKGDDVWTAQYGISATSEPLTETHVFAMGSVSKTITSATILKMYEDSLLSLDDPISNFLPTYQNIDSTISVRQLLAHTSGIYNYTEHSSYFQDVFTSTAIIQPADVVTNYILAPNFPAGTNWSYSNTNYVLLGMIVEAISGKTYYEEARRRFDFDNKYPSMAIPPHDMSPEDLAHLWVNLYGTGVLDAQASGVSLVPLFSSAGAAGAYASTPSDLTRWARDLYSGALLQPSTMDELRTASSYQMYYGLGAELINIPACAADLVGHSGNILYTSATYYDATNDVSVSVHTNDADSDLDMSALAFEMFCIHNRFSSTNEQDALIASLNAYPNPFHEQLTISYELPTSQTISLTLLDNTGRQIMHIDQSDNASGTYEKVINTSSLAAGVYFLQTQVDNEVYYEKVVKM